MKIEKDISTEGETRRLITVIKDGYVGILYQGKAKFAKKDFEEFMKNDETEI
jgi:hypothetical protein